MSITLLVILSTLAIGNNFNAAFKVLMQYEGVSYHNNPRDPGGPTKFGITLRTLRRETARNVSRETNRNVSRETLKNLTERDAKLYYRENWWRKYQVSEIDSKRLSIALFLGMVNIGPRRPVRALQDLLNDVCDAHLDEDGILGTQTIVAANMCDRAADGYPFYLHLLYKSDPRISPVWNWAKNGLRNRLFHFEDNGEC